MDERPSSGLGKTVNLPATLHFRRLAAVAGAPLAVQVTPDRREQLRTGLTDPLGEETYSPVPGLIHRYPDRALIISTTECFSYCRFCTRKRNWKTPFDIKQHWGKILSYIRATVSIREVILSGGDPLTLPDSVLLGLLSDLKSIRRIERFRLATRALTYQPDRITDRLARRLGEFFPLYLMTHFNHPAELGTDAARACRRLNRNGIILLNQTVLLKKVNDSVDTLAELSYRLLANGIKPYALHLLDEAQGTGHFKVSAAQGKKLIHEMRKERTGIGIPLLVLDKKGGGGKQLV
jgi:lysine 2,3-aminomutase